MRRIAVAFLSAALAVVASAVSASAAPPGPESAANCTFVNGATVCATVGQPVLISTQAGFDSGCFTFSNTYATTTTYAAHRGTFNSQGVELTLPPTVTLSYSTTQDCFL